jgi:hypothetical protein
MATPARAQRLQLAAHDGDTQALSQSRQLARLKLSCAGLTRASISLEQESTEDREVMAKKGWTAPKSGSPDFDTSNAQVG